MGQARLKVEGRLSWFGAITIGGGACCPPSRRSEGKPPQGIRSRAEGDKWTGALAFKQVFPRLERTNYCTDCSLWRGQDLGEDCEAASDGPIFARAAA
jgi:hypothetical protein